MGDGAQVTTETPVRMELHLDPLASVEEFAIYHGELLGFSDISYYERGVYTVTESVTALTAPVQVSRLVLGPFGC